MVMSAPVPVVPDRSRRDWTVEEVDNLPGDGNRYEVIDGELLVTPSPSELHQDAVGELFVRIKAYADSLHFHAFVAPTAITFSAQREVQPDLLVLPALDGRRVRAFRDVGRLALAVEVLSSHTARVDRYVKRPLFQSEGVPEYWIVDPALRLVERWRPGDKAPEVALDVLTWQPVADAAPLTIDLAEYFRAVYGA